MVRVQARDQLLQGQTPTSGGGLCHRHLQQVPLLEQEPRGRPFLGLLSRLGQPPLTLSYNI